MKIKSTDSLTSASSVRKAGKAKAASGSSFATHLEEASEAQGVTGTAAVGNIDSILSLQAEENSLNPNGRAKKYGNEVLDNLDKILLDILAGGVPINRLRQLADLMQRQREYAGVDGKMLDLIDEIETRALVELAKFEASSA
jgi:hypothetical protein